MSPSGDDVVRIPLQGDLYNAYLVGDVLVDAGTKKHPAKVLAGVAGREVRALLVSHAHPDHAGGAGGVIEALGVPAWASEPDAPCVERGEASVNSSILKRFGKARPVPLQRRLRDGDEVAAGFRVLATPGHTPGHVSLWREEDRALLAIDAIFNINPVTRRRALQLGPRIFIADRDAAVATVKRLAEMEPAVVYFGHGAPLRDPAALRAFADAL